ncbi:hypothetical protein SAMN05192529_102126 [Arachidicoccus rhizosphaerae]|uniref:DUF7336 domain-containing protein n=1 Tax=Arachidicoccus rhizosphaerae TaxID=551991 RepID=A0A1H3W4D4_9BACT|nr:hypothetical protein [Arachidicoccus rhizosphaerae]SDZ81979.1 hypothetical protein SAMN05192529_102126 [Arachidicoccus rhizosphaerae]
MKIYIVTDGCYSDYSIRGVFTTKENAEKFIRAYSFDEPSIEEYESDNLNEEIQNGNTCFVVFIDKDGNNAKAEKSNTDYGDYRDYVGKAYIDEKKFFGNDYSHNARIRNTVWAKDEKHAIKIANERRIRVLAEGRWNEK